MEAGEVKWEEALLGPRWRVDELGNAYSHLILNIVDRIDIQLLSILFSLSLAFNVFQMLC